MALWGGLESATVSQFREPGLEGALVDNFEAPQTHTGSYTEQNTLMHSSALDQLCFLSEFCSACSGLPSREANPKGEAAQRCSKH